MLESANLIVYCHLTKAGNIFVRLFFRMAIWSCHVQGHSVSSSSVGVCLGQHISSYSC